MHEQSVLVTDLMQCGASEPAIEKERRTLRKLESARFKQFRNSIIGKLKRNAVRQRKKLMEPKKVAFAHLHYFVAKLHFMLSIFGGLLFRNIGGML